jgi:hypothetical protein
MIFKYFRWKILRKIGAQNEAKLCKNWIIKLVFEKNANFFAQNWKKSQKIVIITSAPGQNNQITKNRDNNIDPPRIGKQRRINKKQMFWQIFVPDAKNIFPLVSKRSPWNCTTFIEKQYPISKDSRCQSYIT